MLSKLAKVIPDFIITTFIGRRWQSIQQEVFSQSDPEK